MYSSFWKRIFFYWNKRATIFCLGTVLFYYASFITAYIVCHFNKQIAEWIPYIPTVVIAIAEVIYLYFIDYWKSKKKKKNK
jgi:hypothetical protein